MKILCCVKMLVFFFCLWWKWKILRLYIHVYMSDWHDHYLTFVLCVAMDCHNDYLTVVLCVAIIQQLAEVAWRLPQHSLCRARGAVCLGAYGPPCWKSQGQEFGGIFFNFYILIHFWWSLWMYFIFSWNIWLQSAVKSTWDKGVGTLLMLVS